MAGGFVVACGLVVACRLLWRAGLPRVGARSAPTSDAAVQLINRGVRFWGLLRSPTRGKPARHNKPARHDKPSCHNQPARHNKPPCHGEPIRPGFPGR
ncbi:hypothetical protein FPT15_16950 [Pseudomonas sp. RGB]|nr:hypothetical protein FPT15_16950 [Pseudomonas sp. RGB]